MKGSVIVSYLIGIVLLPCVDSFAFMAGMDRFRRSSPCRYGANAELGLLSLDLDDTLFPTEKVVRSANEVMISKMRQIGCTDATIPQFLDNTRSIRKSLTEPVTYRDMRKKTIRKTMLESTAFQNTDGMKDIERLVEDCYEFWVKERHAAAERYLFDDAVETLQKLREKYPKACFAAITNGSGSPLVMSKTLAGLFDLRVSGDDEGVFPHRKPHPHIYEYTLERYERTKDVHDGVWCHVGDCLANDVGASAACGAKAIWMCVEDKEEPAASKYGDQKRAPDWTTASSGELEQRAKLIAKGQESVTVKIGRLAELPDAIEMILSSYDHKREVAIPSGHSDARIVLD